MASLDLSAASNVLKVRYIGPIREQINQKTVLLSRLEKEEGFIDVSGKTFTVPIHTGRNVSAGSARTDGGTLPTAGVQQYQTAVIPNAYVYTTIKVTGPTIRATRDSAGAFVRAVDSETRGATKDMKREVNRMLNGDGSGALAYWTTADDTSGFTVDDSQGNGFVHLPKAGTITCDLIDASDNSTKLGDSIVVTRGASSAASVAITATGTVSGSADGDYLVKEDTLGNELMGLRGIVSASNPTLLTGGLHGLAVASHPYWTAQEFGNSGVKRDLDLDIMQAPLDAIAMESDFDESDVSFLLANYAIRAKYVSLLQADKRFVNTMTLDGGFTAVEFNGKPMILDPQCDRGKIYYIVPESLRIFRTSDFDWMDQDGSVLARVANEDAYSATLFAYMNLGCLYRNANAVLKDLND